MRSIALSVLALTSFGIAVAADADAPSADPSAETEVAEPALAVPGPDAAPAPELAQPEPVQAEPSAPKPRIPTAEDPNVLTPAESMAWRDLREVVLRERAIWDRLKAQPDEEAEKRRANAELRQVMTGYENVIRSAPKFAEAYAAYGLLLNRTGNREEAVRVLLKANEINPALPMVKNEIGNYLFEDGRYKDALGYYLAAIQLKGDEPLYHYQLGSLLREYRRFFIADGLFTGATLDAKMQEAFRRAAELSPDTWGYTYRYAESFYDLETPDWPAALAEWTRLEIRAKPGVEKQAIHLHQSNVLARMDRRDEARQLVDSIVEPSLQTSKAEVLALIDPPPEPPTSEATDSTLAGPVSAAVADGATPEIAGDSTEEKPTAVSPERASESEEQATAPESVPAVAPTE